MAKDDPGMRGYRPRNRTDGRLRDTRDDKHVGTLEKQYNRDFGVLCGHSAQADGFFVGE